MKLLSRKLLYLLLSTVSTLACNGQDSFAEEDILFGQSGTKRKYNEPEIIQSKKIFLTRQHLIDEAEFFIRTYNDNNERSLNILKSLFESPEFLDHASKLMYDPDHEEMIHFILQKAFEYSLPILSLLKAGDILLHYNPSSWILFEPKEIQNTGLYACFNLVLSNRPYFEDKKGQFQACKENFSPRILAAIQTFLDPRHLVTKNFATDVIQNQEYHPWFRLQALQLLTCHHPGHVKAPNEIYESILQDERLSLKQLYEVILSSHNFIHTPDQFFHALRLCSKRSQKNKDMITYSNFGQIYKLWHTYVLQLLENEHDNVDQKKILLSAIDLHKIRSFWTVNGINYAHGEDNERIISLVNDVIHECLEQNRGTSELLKLYQDFLLSYSQFYTKQDFHKSHDLLASLLKQVLGQQSEDDKAKTLSVYLEFSIESKRSVSVKRSIKTLQEVLPNTDILRKILQEHIENANIFEPSSVKIVPTYNNGNNAHYRHLLAFFITLCEPHDDNHIFWAQRLKNFFRYNWQYKNEYNEYYDVDGGEISFTSWWFSPFLKVLGEKHPVIQNLIPFLLEKNIQERFGGALESFLRTFKDLVPNKDVYGKMLQKQLEKEHIFEENSTKIATNYYDDYDFDYRLLLAHIINSLAPNSHDLEFWTQRGENFFAHCSENRGQYTPESNTYYNDDEEEITFEEWWLLPFVEVLGENHPFIKNLYLLAVEKAKLAVEKAKIFVENRVTVAQTYNGGYTSLYPRLLAHIVALLEPNDPWLDFWTRRVENFFQHCWENKSKDDDDYFEDQDITFCEWWVTPFVKIAGENHSVTQKLISLAIAIEDINKPNNYFSIYKSLLLKRKEVVQHNFANSRIGVGEKAIDVTLNFDHAIAFNELLTPVVFSVPPQKAQESTERLSKEYDQLPPESRAFIDSQLGKLTLDFVINQGMPTILRALSSISPTILDHKVRRLMYEVTSQENSNSSLKGISAGSLLLFQLLINMQTCPSGKAEGIHMTDRLLPYNSDNHGIDEPITPLEEFKLYLLKQFQKEKEVALNSMVKGLINTNDHDTIIHSTTYVRNLLDVHIGLCPTTEIPSIDYNGTYTDPKILNMSTQELLDIFYQHYFRPIDLINRIKILFDHKDIQILDINGNDVTWNAILSTLDDFEHDKDRRNHHANNYFMYDQYDDPCGITYRGVAEILLRLGFLKIPPL